MWRPIRSRMASSFETGSDQVARCSGPRATAKAVDQERGGEEGGGRGGSRRQSVQQLTVPVTPLSLRGWLLRASSPSRPPPGSPPWPRAPPRIRPSLPAIPPGRARPRRPAATPRSWPRSTVEPITRAELDERAASALTRLRQEEYDVLSRTLDEMISERLVEAEADGSGTVDRGAVRAGGEPKDDPAVGGVRRGSLRAEPHALRGGATGEGPRADRGGPPRAGDGRKPGPLRRHAA